jgi:hypothetical protein
MTCRPVALNAHTVAIFAIVPNNIDQRIWQDKFFSHAVLQAIAPVERKKSMDKIEDSVRLEPVA